jgi:ABC-type polysaccharide/polyol phosphate export permease
MTTTVYDSDEPRTPLLTEARNLWRYRGLLRLLVVRDLTVRYKRSTLGVWWTLLNPLLTMGVMWVVFSRFFKFTIPGVPFSVYLLSGILLVTFFSQGVMAVGAAVVNNASVLSKVHVPAEIFSFSAATAAAVNFLLSLIPLLIIQLIAGVGIPWTVFLVVIPVICLLALVSGLGLILASGAVHFFDLLDLTSVFIQLIGYLTPTFYPVEGFIPPEYQPLIFANPLYSYLLVFRGFVYEGVFAPWWAFAVMGGTALGALALGVWVFSRSWKSLVVLI